MSCALSPLQADGFPLVVVLGGTVDTQSSLKGFVLQNWLELPDFFPLELNETVELFLADVRVLCGLRNDDTSTFVESLAGLSIGPLRSFASGVCETSDLHDVLNGHLGGIIPPVAWPHSFVDLSS